MRFCICAQVWVLQLQITTCAFVFVRKFGSCAAADLQSRSATRRRRALALRCLVLSPRRTHTRHADSPPPHSRVLDLPPTNLPPTRTRPALSMLTPMLPPPCFTASRAPCVLGRTATRRNESKVRAYLGLAIAASCLTPVAHTLCKPDLRCKPSHRSGL